MLHIVRCLLGLFLLVSLPVVAVADDDFAAFETDISFDDAPRTEPNEYPPWFKQSFLDLPEDLRDAISARKRGLVIYFGQKNCAYCYRLLNTNLRIPEIVSYITRHFDVVPVNIWDTQQMTDLQGRELTVREFAVREKADLTPTLVFFDYRGKEVFRLRGYLPPYQFRAAFEFVADEHYRHSSFRDYVSKGDFAAMENEGGMSKLDLFSRPPFMLDRSHFKGDRPLVVFFEQANCHPCDVLHSEPLEREAVRDLLKQFEAVQLDMWSDTPVLTPDGRRMTARQWAEDLQLFFAPTMVFFDADGREVFRIDSVVHLLRLRNILDYVLQRGYEKDRNFAVWRARRAFGEIPAAYAE